MTPEHEARVFGRTLTQWERRRFNSQTWGWRSYHFVAFFHYNGLKHISLGVHVHLGAPNIEIHVPFGFFRIGRPRWN